MPDQPQNGHSSAPTGQEVNWLQAREAVEEHDEILLEIIRIFVEDCPRWLSEINEAVATNNLEELSHSAHSLKGAASTIAALPLAQAAAELERISHAGQVAALPTISDLVRKRSQALVSALTRVLADGHIPNRQQNAH